MKVRIYLDYNATTPLDPHVMAVMQKALENFWGNPSSVHSYGLDAKAALDSARRQIAKSLGAAPGQLVFTSGATEALNLALRGICNYHRSGHIISSTLEHPAVESTLVDLEQQGFEVTRLRSCERGAIDPQEVEGALRSDTRLIALMAANNETGVKNDLVPIASIVARQGIPFVIDGVALLGKEEIPKLEGLTIWCFSAHKIHGPLGAGLALFSPGISFKPILTGGSQQQGRRGGTENLLAILGMAEAFAQLDQLLPRIKGEMARLRDNFERGLIAALPNVLVNGTGERVCNTSNLAFEGVDGESLLYLLDRQGLAASMGSACSSGALEPSRVLLQMGYPRSRAFASLRFSIGRMTTAEEIECATALITVAVQKLLSYPKR